MLVPGSVPRVGHASRRTAAHPCQVKIVQACMGGSLSDHVSTGGLPSVGLAREAVASRQVPFRAQKPMRAQAPSEEP